MKISKLISLSNVKKIAKVTAILSAPLFFSGCLLTAPYWNQAFDSHTDAVPIQAWATSTTTDITLECIQAYHGGLYPPFGPHNWTHISTITPDLPGSVDGDGSRIYSVTRNSPLPLSCWREDPANGTWYAAVRALQGSSAYSTFDIAGLECLGREDGKDASWFGWIGEGCTKTYSNSNNNIPYVIIRADS